MKKNVVQSVTTLFAVAVCVGLLFTTLTGCQKMTEGGKGAAEKQGGGDKKPSSENELLVFQFRVAKHKDAKLPKDIVGKIDPAAKTVTVTIPSDAEVDLKKLKASFTLSAKAKALVGTVEQRSGETVNDFTNPVSYTIVAEDGSKQTYTVKTVPGKAAWNRITDFAFMKSINDDLPSDATCLMGGYDKKGNGYIFVKFPVGTTAAMIKNLKPTFTASDKAEVFIGGTQLESGVTSADFYNLKNGIKITVKAENGDECLYTLVPEVDLPEAPESEVSKYFGSYYGELKSRDLGTNKVIIVLEKDKVTLYTTTKDMSMDYVNVEWEKDNNKYQCITYSKKDTMKLRIKNLYGKLGFTFDETGSKIKTKGVIMRTPITAEKGDDFVWKEGSEYTKVAMHL